MIIRKFLNPNPVPEPYMRIITIYEKEKPRFLYRRGRLYPLNEEAYNLFSCFTYNKI